MNFFRDEIGTTAIDEIKSNGEVEAMTGELEAMDGEVEAMDERQAIDESTSDG